MKKGDMVRFKGLDIIGIITDVLADGRVEVTSDAYAIPLIFTQDELEEVEEQE